MWEEDRADSSSQLHTLILGIFQFLLGIKDYRKKSIELSSSSSSIFGMILFFSLVKYRRVNNLFDS
jgi:hypothetical protein